MPIFTKNICTLNCNGLKKAEKVSLLFDFMIKNDIDLMFLQEVNVEKIRCYAGYDYVMNPGQNERGTGIIYRVGTQISNVLCSNDGRIISATINKIHFLN